jgi:hypothetical protein
LIAFTAFAPSYALDDRLREFQFSESVEPAAQWYDRGNGSYYSGRPGADHEPEL